MKYKRIYDLSIAELKKKSKRFTFTFYAYLIAGLIVSSVMAISGLQSINNVMQYTGENFLLLFVAIICSMNFLFVICLWMFNESSYYRMLEQFFDLMVYLKQKEK
jgi:hypothetical protein